MSTAMGLTKQVMLVLGSWSYVTMQMQYQMLASAQMEQP